MPPSSHSVLDRFLDPLAQCFTPEVAQRIARLELDESMQRHIDLLAEKANEGRLTADEKAEYEEIVDLIDLISLLKLKASAKVRQAG